MAGIYIHIPFCKQACHYCNFHFSTNVSNKAELVKAICTEFEIRKEFLPKEPLTSIYFGGGTPSLLNQEELYSILNVIGDEFPYSKEIEITMECNPDDMSIEYLGMLADAGINRLSIGVQSFFPDELQHMNRAHNAEEALSSIQEAKKFFKNYSVDLIYGSFNSTMETWRENLDIIKSIDPPHISAYCMTIESKTAYGSWVKSGKLKPVDDDLAARQFDYLVEELGRQGHRQYEISNFSKPGKEAVHNTSYWFGTPYLGLGPGAHSYKGTTRSWNIANNIKYIASINSNILPMEVEELTIVEQHNEFVMTRLRTMWGIPLLELEEKFPEEIKEQFYKALKDKELKKDWFIQSQDKLSLTQEGRKFADHIAAKLFAE